MIHMRALGLAIVLAVTVLGGVGSAWAADERPQRAKEMFAAGRYPEALELFAKLYAETLDPLYLRVIGRCHQKMEDPDRAIDAFKEYLRKSKRLATDKRQEVEGFIAEMEALKEQRRRQAAEAARQTAPPPLAVTPSTGPATSPGALPPSLAAPPPAAPIDAVRVSPAADQPDADAGTPIYKRWWFWATIAAVAVAGGVVGATSVDRG